MKKTFLLITVFYFLQFNLLAQNFWEKITSPSHEIVTNLAINTQDYIFAATDSNNIFRSIDNGDTWVQLTNGLPSLSKGILLPLPLEINSNNDIFVAFYDHGDIGGIFRSTDNGENWIQKNKGLTSHGIGAIAINSNNHIFAGTYGATEDNLFLSTDNGENWFSINTNHFDYKTFAFNSHNDIFALMGNALYRSIDNGYTWIILNYDFLLYSTTSIIVNKNDEIFMGCSDGVFKSIDNGENWINFSNGLSYTIYSFTIDSSNHIFGGTHEGGVFLSTDNGDTWIQTNEGLSDFHINTLKVNSEGYIFAATNNGLYRSINSTTSVESDNSFLPTVFLLSQNYPNPFNPTTEIAYSIPNTSLVTLKVYDLLGSEVAILINEEKLAGNYEINFDGTGLSSGIYFYKLQAGNYSSVKKMILMK